MPSRTGVGRSPRSPMRCPIDEVRMPLAPEAEALLQVLDASGIGYSPESTPQSMRDAMRAVLRQGGEPALHAVEDRGIPGPAGEIPVRVYRPSGEPARPVLVWLHGGGWVTGSLDTHDYLCRQLCAES